MVLGTFYPLKIFSHLEKKLTFFLHILEPHLFHFSGETIGLVTLTLTLLHGLTLAEPILLSSAATAPCSGPSISLVSPQASGVPHLAIYAPPVPSPRLPASTIVTHVAKAPTGSSLSFLLSPRAATAPATPHALHVPMAPFPPTQRRPPVTNVE